MQNISPLPVAPSTTPIPLDWDEILPKEKGVFWRNEWDRDRARYGLPFSRGTMQNLSSEGKGPDEFMLGGKVGYRRESLVAWLNVLVGKKLSEIRPAKRRGVVEA